MAREKRGKLTPEGLELYHRVWAKKISKDKYYAFVRDEKGETLSEHWWRPMYEGKTVPWKMLELLCAYLNTESMKKRGLACELNQIAVMTDEPTERLRDPLPWYSGLWFVLWEAIRQALARWFKEDPASRCADREDVRLAARMILEWIGRHNAGADALTLTTERAIENGMRIMARSVEDFTEQLYAYWMAQRDTIRFAVHEGERVGLFVTLPMKREPWKTFGMGAWYDTAITASHLEPKSPFLLILFASERIDDGLPRKKHDKAMQSCMANQLALLSPPVAWWAKKRNLYLLSVGGSPESERVLTGAGYTPTGTFLPVAKKPLYQMTPRSARKAGNTMLYAARLLRWFPSFSIFIMLMTRRDLTTANVIAQLVQ